jgi:hypothetical protein
MSPNDLSWLKGLSLVRNDVVAMERQREIDRKLQRERNEDALRKRLSTDTVEFLKGRGDAVRQRFDLAVRKFCPLQHVAGALAELDELAGLLQFYLGCIEQFAGVFTPGHKTLMPKLLRELGDLRKSMERQQSQWAATVKPMQNISFVERTAKHDEALVAVARKFSERAHNIPLTMPSNYFAHEHENFWVVLSGEDVLGHLRFDPEDAVLTFALAPTAKVNFNKFVRVILHRFATNGPLPQKLDVVRVRVTYQREVKFYTDMGFVRTEVKGPTNWIYERKIG